MFKGFDNKEGNERLEVFVMCCVVYTVRRVRSGDGKVIV